MLLPVFGARSALCSHCVNAVCCHGEAGGAGLQARESGGSGSCMQPGTVACACNPSTREAEAGGRLEPGGSGLQRAVLSWRPC